MTILATTMTAAAATTTTNPNGNARKELLPCLSANVMAPQHVLVVGHGPIGHSFIEKLTEQKAGFKISVLNEEPRPAYNRVMLTKYFECLDSDKHDKMELSYISEAELKELQVNNIYGRATFIDRGAKSVRYTMPNGSEASIGYDVLVIATGSYCFVPPTPGMVVWDKKNAQWPDDPASRPEGVFVYRTIEDLDAMVAAAKRGAKKAAVIGGGLLGLEAAKAVYDLQMESHVLEMAPYLMPVQLNQAAGELVAKKIDALDVKVHCGVKIQEVVLDNGKVVGIKILEKGAEEPVILEIDMLVVSAGVRPRDELAKQCGLELGSRGGVKVDSGLRSSDPAIYALGEVASIGGTFVYGLWAPGVEQADVLVKNLVAGNQKAEYHDSDLSTKLKLMGVEVASFGRDMNFWMKRQFDDNEKSPYMKFEISDKDKGTYQKLIFSEDGTKLMGGLLIGDAKDYTKLLQISKKDDLGNLFEIYPDLMNAPLMPCAGYSYKRVLIIGHGPIGHSFIEKLAACKAGFEISVLNEEPRPAYNRVMLTKYFEKLDGDKHDKMELSYISEAELEDLQVNHIYGRAIAIDREAKSVQYTMPNGSEASVGYDVLVMATGSYCFVPPTPGMTIPEKRNAQWPDDPASRPEGVFVYRTIEDLDAMVAAAKRGAKKAAVIGGGLLGLEAAKAVYDLKMESHVLEMAPYLMPTQLNQAAGELVARKIDALDVKVHCGVKIQEVVLDNGKVVGIKILEKGAEEPVILEINMLVVSAGVRPRDELAKQCGLELGGRGGIKVDAGLRSSDPAIYALGEVASVGGTFCYGLWAPGVEQAEILVKNLVTGKQQAEYYDSDLSTKLKLMGVEVASFGRDMDFWMKRQFEDNEKSPYRKFEFSDTEKGTYQKLIFSADGTKLMGGLLVGDAKDYTKLLQISKKDNLDSFWEMNSALKKMPMMPCAGISHQGRHILVLGHGPIGHSFIEKVNEAKAGFKVSVLNEEPRPAYNRVMLTQYFEDRDGCKHDKMKLSYVTEDALNDAGVQHIYGRAIAIDRKAKSVKYKMPGGSEASIGYDVLVMATGSYCFVPPTPGMVIPEKANPQWPDDPASRPEGVFVYRTIEDLDAMIAAAKKGAKRAAVIGGGLLGLEAAKAVYDLNLESHVLEMAPYLMPTQLNQAAGKVLVKKIEELNVKVHTGIKIQEVVLEGGKVVGIKILEQGQSEPMTLDVDMIVVSCGVRPRDELAKKCGLELGVRGGIKVNGGLCSSDPSIYAIGECAAIGGTFCYGLWAPGVEQAEALLKNLLEGSNNTVYDGSDLSTKLKLMGVAVASFGRDMDFWMKRHFDSQDPELISIECMNGIQGVYRKLIFSADGSRLMGGILVGDAEDYTKLLQLSKKDDLGGKDAAALTYNIPIPAGAGGEVAVQDDGTGCEDDDLVCTCIALAKKDIVDCIEKKECTTMPQLKKSCKVGTGCGGCITPVGAVPKILAVTLKRLGKVGAVGICPHFAFSRKQLFDICKVKEIKSYEDLLAAVGKGHGCEICKPICASILAGLWNENLLKGGREELQDTNDRFCGNVQKTGTYSVIPRCPGGDISPDELIAFANCAKKFGLWTKITGAQRLGMFGAKVHQLPSIWRELVDAGMESGQAYGKALRTVKSCVGSTWCRYGQQDSVTLAVVLENRYKGIRSPHKMKMGVSGCLRECAEAQGKDFGFVATQKGYNMYVCGNGGARPQHATLLAQDIDAETCVKYTDRTLMYYTSTAKHLERTAPWLNNLQGGIGYLKQIIVDDILGINEDLERMIEKDINTYADEWKTVAYDRDLRKKFHQFVNTDETLESEQIDYMEVRKQRHPNTYALPDITGPAVYSKDNAPKEGEQGWSWIFAGDVIDYPTNLGQAVKHGNAELAVFHLPKRTEEQGQWFCTQNMSPNKQSRTISRGLVGQTLDGIPTVAEPIWKATYNLITGNGMAIPALNLSTFKVRVAGEKVEVFVPPAEELANAFEQQSLKAISGAGFVKPAAYPYPYVHLGGETAVYGLQPPSKEVKKPDLDW